MIYHIEHVTDCIRRGWLIVDIEGIGKRPIPLGTRVELLGNNITTQSVMILEGLFQHFNAKIPYRKNSWFNSLSYLVKSDQKVDAKELQLTLKDNALLLDDISISVITNNISKGKLYLGIPLYPHEVPEKYFDEKKGGSRFASSWFSLASSPDMLRFSTMFLHLGKYSKGCITVNFMERNNISWNKVYTRLINERFTYGIVGTLTVV